jgi:hypothetical protein
MTLIGVAAALCLWGVVAFAEQMKKKRMPSLIWSVRSDSSRPRERDEHQGSESAHSLSFAQIFLSLAVVIMD